MAYDGFEIDMLDIGEANCLLLSRWRNQDVQRILIDGGRNAHSSYVKKFLKTKRIFRLNHVVCTHSDSDHCQGLIPLVMDPEFEIEQAWVHDPRRHADLDKAKVMLKEAVNGEYKSEAMYIQASLKDNLDLMEALADRKILNEEPFTGATIGFLTVCGPSQNYYQSLLNKFRDRRVLLQELQKSASVTAARKGKRELKDNPSTTPENNSSVIMMTDSDLPRKFVFTGDAGVEALRLAASVYDLKNCHWMQIPHHGSVNNINRELIQYFSARTGFISADGSEHPDRAVVEAFKSVETRVYGTCGTGSLWHRVGAVPPRTGYSDAPEL